MFREKIIGIALTEELLWVFLLSEKKIREYIFSQRESFEFGIHFAKKRNVVYISGKENWGILLQKRGSCSPLLEEV